MKWYYPLFGLQTIAASLLAVWLLYRWQALFATIARPLLREVFRVTLLSVVFYSAFMPANLAWHRMPGFYRHPWFAIGSHLYASIIAVATTLFHWWMAHSAWYRKDASRQAGYSFLLIALCPVLLDAAGQYFLTTTQSEYITNISFSLFIGCCAAMVYLFFRFYSRKTELRMAEVRRLKLQAELDALHAKINPHFLYNALSGLAGLSLEDGRKASRMATALSHLFRYNLNKEQQLLATVEEEVEMAETYLEIERIRFEEKLQVDVMVDHAVRNKKMPRFLLQPLVENCIKHGFQHMHTRGHIQVSITGVHQLLIEVQDNGQPFPEAVQHGFGLDSIRHKLHLLFPGRHQVLLQNQPYKAICIIIQNEQAEVPQ